jgi:cytosine permease
MPKMYDYEVSSVPKNHRRSLFNLTVVTTGLAVAMSTLYTGQALAPGLTLSQTILATIAGCICLWGIMAITGSIGTKTGYATVFNTRRSLGLKGSRILSLVMAIPLFGWFAFQASFFGQTVNILFPNSVIFDPQVAAVWGGLLMTSTAIFGYKGLTWLSMIAFPFLYLFSTSGVYLSNEHVGLSTIADIIPLESMSIGAGITIVIGSYAVDAVNQSDISRYGKNPKHNSLASLLAMICFCIAIVAGTIMIMATGSENIMKATTVLGMGAYSLLFILLLQWTTNDSNLYAAALAICNIKSFPKWKVSLIIGVISSIIAGMGIYNYFDAFLSILGTFIPPIAGILAIDFYIFNRDKHSPEYIEGEGISDYNIPGLISFIGSGSVTYMISILGYSFMPAAIFSMLLASLSYFILTSAIKNKSRATSRFKVKQ